MVSAASRFHVEAAEQAERKLQQATLFHNDVLSQLGTETGRRNFWRLIAASKALDKSIAHSTATMQASNVAMRDFGMEHLVLPALDLCPELFLQMRAENDGSNSGHAG